MSEDTSALRKRLDRLTVLERRKPLHAASGTPVAVLMSGGVDSSTVALLLREEGFAPFGLTLKLTSGSAAAVRDAGCVCEHLDIGHVVLDFCAEFEALVVEPFRRAYLMGFTPSPCVVCNPRVKFGLAMDWITHHHSDIPLATGHYAHLAHTSTGPRLARARDRIRDQSYFLYAVGPERLARVRFPLGDLAKEDTRRIADAAGLPVAQRTDSMELCFAEGGDYRNALGNMSTGPGPIEHVDGRILGEHEGVENFTVGQRRGIRVAAQEPYYVIGFEMSRRAVVVGPRSAAMAREVTAREVVVHAQGEYASGLRVGARLRSSGEPAPCEILVAEDDQIRVRFDDEVFAPAAGQHLVLYNDAGVVIAGGVIVK